MNRIILFLSTLLLAGSFSLQAQNPYYGIKSGHLKYETRTSGGIQYNEVWFDDYGLLRKQHDQIMMEGMGNYHTEVLFRDGNVYSSSWFDNEKADEAAMSEGLPDMNFLHPSDAFIEKSRFKEVGTEEIFGKICKVYTYKTKSLLRTVSNKVWVWEGIVLKMETKGALGADNSMMVTEFKENPKLSPGTFAIPDKVKKVK